MGGAAGRQRADARKARRSRLSGCRCCRSGSDTVSGGKKSEGSVSVLDLNRKSDTCDFATGLDARCEIASTATGTVGSLLRRGRGDSTFKVKAGQPDETLDKRRWIGNSSVRRVLGIRAHKLARTRTATNALTPNMRTPTTGCVTSSTIATMSKRLAAPPATARLRFHSAGHHDLSRRLLLGGSDRALQRGCRRTRATASTPNRSRRGRRRAAESSRSGGTTSSV